MIDLFTKSPFYFPVTYLLFVLMTLLVGFFFYDMKRIWKYNKVYHFMQDYSYMSKRTAIFGSFSLTGVASFYGYIAYREYASVQKLVWSIELTIFFYGAVTAVIMLCYWIMMKRYKIPDTPKKQTAKVGTRTIR